MGDERLHNVPRVVRLSPQPGAAGDQTLEGKPPARQELSSSVVDITDEALEAIAVGEDFPVVVYLREILANLRAENEALREEAELERRRARLEKVEADRARADQGRLREANRSLEKSLKEERRRANRLEARLQKLESRRPGSRLDERPSGPFSAVRRAFGRGRSPDEHLDAQQAARIETVGKMAHLHKEMMEKKGGPLTLGESLELRRFYYGDNVRASASLFGRADGRAILYRDVPEGTRRSPNDPVRLTEEGERLAAAYRRRMR